MARSSILGGEPAPNRAAGNDVDALGPSDSSDSGSDVQGERAMATGADNPGEWGGLPVERHGDSDAMGTGERASATGDGGRANADILPDHIIDPGARGGSDDAMGDVADLAGDDSEDEDDGIEGTGPD